MFSDAKMKRITTAFVLFTLVICTVFYLYQASPLSGQSGIGAGIAWEVYKSLKDELAKLRDKTIPKLEADRDKALDDVEKWENRKVQAQTIINSCNTKISANKARIRVLSAELKKLNADIATETSQIEWLDAWIASFAVNPSPSEQQQKDAYLRERAQRIATRASLRDQKAPKDVERGQLFVLNTALRTRKAAEIIKRDAAVNKADAAARTLARAIGSLVRASLRAQALPDLILSAKAKYERLKAEEDEWNRNNPDEQ